MEKAQRAFVSFVRAYREHHCNFIFRFAQLELGTRPLPIRTMRSITSTGSEPMISKSIHSVFSAELGTSANHISFHV
jgi:hypothetical protein